MNMSEVKPRGRSKQIAAGAHVNADLVLWLPRGPAWEAGVEAAHRRPGIAA